MASDEIGYYMDDGDIRLNLPAAGDISGLPIVIILGASRPELAEIAGFAHLPAIMTCMPVDDWNRDLAPWPAPDLRRGEAFGGGADATLHRLEARASSLICRFGGKAGLGLAGYSLAGLFALWAATKTGIFRSVASMSGALWYEGFTDYMQAHRLQADLAYLSLGNMEPHTRNPRLALVGSATEKVCAIIRRHGSNVFFEWNVGGHFKGTALRIAKGISFICSH